eukprot:TRINITY_DN92004_c0_g1_i1.p1 TRINITY_DN92004_c0_g1~~TRINITY_DN92004_c0_g1_i1.p1  ORF type:complete len:1138 (+),score=163.76 TRINITY_DN92004_c0_g1_i1:57-3416(+)
MRCVGGEQKAMALLLFLLIPLFMGETHVRRLNEDHEDVETNTTARDATVQDDWDHDFTILKPIVESRGYNTSGVQRLCELPCVYCNTGYRRRVPTYAAKLMSTDWVGKEYQLVLTMNPGISASMNASLFDLRRVGYFQVYVNSGEMPPGIERLNTTKMVWIEGNKTHGLEGSLPAAFWSMRTRMLLLASMGPQFTGHLDPVLPMCSHLDYRLYLYRLPGFTGDVAALRACSKITNTIEVFLNPQLGGNAWDAVLGWDSLVSGSILLWGSNFSGSFPSGDWAAWCQARQKIKLRVSQTVGGPLPPDLGQCSNILSRLHIADGQITGAFPFNFSQNMYLVKNMISLWGNSFTGTLPDIAPNITEMDLHETNFKGEIPASWYNGVLEKIDLSDCGMGGNLPNVPPSVKKLLVSGNGFKGPVPQSWFNALNLEEVDLSDNQITGPPFTWGWPGNDPDGNYDVTTFLDSFKVPPRWPLKILDLSRNPLKISAGFLLGMLGQYELVELRAASADLHGFVRAMDLYAQEPSAGGGIVTSSASAYTNLQLLDLSNNSLLKNFGYDSLVAEKALCWQGEEWSLRLPNLEQLLLRDCLALESIHPKCLDLDTLDVRGAANLRSFSVVLSRDNCSQMLGMPVATCSGETWPVCLYAGQESSDAADGSGKTCSQVMTSGGSGGQVLLSPELFNPEVLCEGNDMTETEPETERVVDDFETTIMIAVVVGIIVVSAAIMVICWLMRKWGKRQSQSQPKAKVPEKQPEIQIQITGPGQADSAMDSTMQNTETAFVFQDADLNRILNIGISEHWFIGIDRVQVDLTQAQLHGGFGEVLRGTMLGGTDVAIKTPRTQSERVYKALCNEMRLFRRIRHPNIVLFHGATILQVNSSPQLAIILEWVAGGDFGAYVRNRRNAGLFERECALALKRGAEVVNEQKILIDAARGLVYLHGQTPPILHRDLKPGNVLVENTEPPRGKLADFGLSVVMEGEEPSMRAGTASYMAPEVRDRQAYGTAADVYSFGCLSYFAIFAESPQDQESGIISRLRDSSSLPGVSLVGCACLKTDASKRPDMQFVYECLMNNQAAVTTEKKSAEESTMASGGNTSARASSSSGSKPSGGPSGLLTSETKLSL